MAENMPKFERKFTKDALTIFLRNFDMWIEYKRIADEKKKKSVLTSAISNPIAQHWFLINNDKIQDAGITYKDFV